MKIICLNVASGLYFENLMEFITEHKATTDLFCFQEVSNWTCLWDQVRKNLLADLQPVLSNFNAHINDYENYEEWSIVTYIHNTHSIIYTQSGILAQHTLPKEMWWVADVGMYMLTDIQYWNKVIRVINIHGVRYPYHKFDSPEREIQYNNLEKLIQEQGIYAHIILWDFNLHPETTTIRKLSEQLVNLNERFGITDTRWPWTPYYWTNQYQPYADYAFASASIPVRSYAVEEQILSDHKALILELAI